jgi:hypothetical protein
MLVGEDEDPLRTPTITTTSSKIMVKSSANISMDGVAYRRNKPSLEHLPRTLAWKIQLQLWELPPLSSGDILCSDSNNEVAVEVILKFNQSRWEGQKEYIQTLKAKHMWKNSPLELIQHLSIKVEREEEEEGTGNTTNSIKKSKEADPLSALMVESQEKHGEDGGWKEFYNNREMIDLIYKDLNRLSPKLLFLEEDHDPNVNTPQHQQQQKQQREDRLRLLADILFCYAKEHPQLGYRQGMHEVLAHILVALDLEEEEQYSSSPPSPLYVFENAYLLFQGWMDQGIHHAYESSTTMGQNILHLIQSANKELYQLLASLQQTMGVPPELYCSKWIRLLFSREVSSIHQVLHLWDTLLTIYYNPIPYVWPPSSSSSSPSATSSSLLPSSSSLQQDIQLTLVDIIESAACSMILLQRKLILSLGPTTTSTTSSSTTNSSTANRDIVAYHDCLHFLMNYPCIQDIADWKRMIQRVVQFVVQTRLGIIKPKIRKTTVTASTTVRSQHDSSNPPYYPDSNTSAKKVVITDTALPPNATALSDSIHAVTDPFLSRVGTFFEGVKTSAQQVIATMDDSLKNPPSRSGSTNIREEFWIRRNITTPTATTTTIPPSASNTTAAATAVANVTLRQQERGYEGGAGGQDKDVQRTHFQQLTQHMEHDITVLKNYIDSTTNDVSSIPNDVVIALEGLEHTQKALLSWYVSSK